jgi:hypothetical protein
VDTLVAIRVLGVGLFSGGLALCLNRCPKVRVIRLALTGLDLYSRTREVRRLDLVGCASHGWLVVVIRAIDPHRSPP